jgi:methyltransferase-like protein/cyclopropane fatty-acyl-phospholipid synthase-like methyltransferase
MNPAPVARCRVLELGCGDGGNLIPIAYTLPESQFLGLDLSERSIAQGQQMIQALALTNISLRRLDILATGPDLGKFDYIVAHGVYSWVPPAVQDRILSVCRENLNSHGVAFISYSVYPGAHVRAMLAEMLQYHASRFAEPQEQVQQAQALLTFLATANPPDDTYTLLLRQEAENLLTRRPELVYHDHLAEFQSPVYFHEFVDRAARHALQYLAEADFFEMLDTSYAPEVSSVLRKLARDPIDKEQYMDFLKCRRFRQTLLCHAAIPLHRQIDSARVKDFFISVKKPDPEKLPSDHPLAKAAMAVLTDASPTALDFAGLLERTVARSGVHPNVDQLLADLVLAFFACGLCQLHIHPPHFAITVGDRPVASAVARHQALTGDHVTNLCHQTVHLEDPLSIRLLLALDGTRDRTALLEELRPHANAEAIGTLPQDLDRALEALARLALLVESDGSHKPVFEP